MESQTNLFRFEEIELDNKGKSVDATLIFEEINKELEEYLLEKSIDTDSTDGVFEFLESLTKSIKTDFDEVIGQDSVKKRLIRALTRVFALLLNTKVDTVDKIKKIWQEQNQLFVEQEDYQNG